mmetsp:Transcript_5893/g.17619  ORF Transcript_5893/g.17619 Transcript_5893/m.17619 type:complete len:280 (+) Transcript_5893:631-1470(+)
MHKFGEKRWRGLQCAMVTSCCWMISGRDIQRTDVRIGFNVNFFPMTSRDLVQKATMPRPYGRDDAPGDLIFHFAVVRPHVLRLPSADQDAEADIARVLACQPTAPQQDVVRTHLVHKIGMVLLILVVFVSATSRRLVAVASLPRCSVCVVLTMMCLRRQLHRTPVKRTIGSGVRCGQCITVTAFLAAGGTPMMVVLVMILLIAMPISSPIRSFGTTGRAWSRHRRVQLIVCSSRVAFVTTGNHHFHVAAGGNGFGLLATGAAGGRRRRRCCFMIAVLMM